MRLLLAGVLALCACGDPRTVFVGNYEGALKETVTFSNAPPSSSTDTVSFTI